MDFSPPPEDSDYSPPPPDYSPPPPEDSDYSPPPPDYSPPPPDSFSPPPPEDSDYSPPPPDYSPPPPDSFSPPPPDYSPPPPDSFSPPPPEDFPPPPPTKYYFPPPPPKHSDSFSPPPPLFGNGSGTAPSTSSSKSSSSVGIGVGAAVAIVIIVMGITISICICLRRRKAKKLASNGVVSTQIPPATTHDYEAARRTGSLTGLVGLSDTSRPKGSSHLGNRSFTYEQLSLATKNFSDAELLGQGGSGPVYKGMLPDDGSLVAVKCIPENSNQGLKEFNAEVSIISELRHRNLVKLKGWCHDQGKFLVVYDYMPNGSLDYLLYNDALCFKLNWERRYSIATGLGSALLYLHEECDRVIIHRDVKSSNVLLDEGFVAKLGDFGLSRQVDPGVTSHKTTVVAGTKGYMAPECFMGSGKATKETDMYAFGAVLLEVVSGRRPLDIASLREYDGVLVDWVWDLFGKGKVLLAVDKRLGTEWDSEEAKRMLVVGLACSHPDPQTRPKMRRALEALHGTVDLLYVPPSKRTASFAPSCMSTSTTSSSDTSTSKRMGSTSTTSSSGTSTSNSSSSHDPYIFSRPVSHFAR